MNCKHCHAELEEGVLFCQECGAAVEENETETALTCRQCGAELKLGAKFCNQCGAAVAEQSEEPAEEVLKGGEDGTENPVPAVQMNDFVQNAKSRIQQKPKYFGAIGIVAAILVVASLISLGVSASRKTTSGTSKSGSASAVSNSGSSASKSGSSSSSKALTTELKKLIVESALLKEIKDSFPLADAGSTKYSINKSEKEGNYTIVYGRLTLYDKYGKTTKGRAGSSGSSSRTFEVKISNSTLKAVSCTIK